MARAESSPDVSPPPFEPSYAVGASYPASWHEYRGHGALVEGARRVGRGPFWARVAVGGGVLTSPLHGGGGITNDPGRGTFARGTLGIEARASSGEATIFGGVDVGYEYLSYDHEANIESDAIMDTSHAPVVIRGGLELGGPRLRLRGAIELFGYQERGVALALGVISSI